MMEKKTKSARPPAAPEPFAVPPLTEDAGYASASVKLGELVRRATELEARREALSAGLNTPSRRADLNTRAQILLDDDVVARSGEAEAAKARQDVADVVDQLSVVRAAIALQAQVVDREVGRVSRAVCAALAPTHRRIVGEIATRLRALGESLAAEHDLRVALDAAQIMSHSSWLRPMNIPSLGLPTDENSGLRRWLREAAEHGLID